MVFGYLQNKEAVAELFSTIATKIGERPGGYLRVVKLGFRRGDGAETALIEFVDFNEVYNPNVGKVRTSGVELGLSAFVSSALEVGSNYTYINLENVSDPTVRITDIPRQKLTAYANYRATE